MKIDKTVFDKMLAMADYAAKGHIERRQVEFRISISYITLLSLALYHVIKLDGTGDVPELVALVCVLLLALHCVYCNWLFTIHTASNNDVRRRDFYLKKAEVIAYYMSKNSDSDFIPSSTETVVVNLGAGDSREMSESELFDQREPDIYVRSKRIGTPPPKWFKNVHFLFPTSFATLMALSLIVALIAKTIGGAIKSVALQILL
ncbi:MAG: hypothetical protein OXM61_00480 [Candidatus Poribacteria bacterium]|nr:hypothetical protein [Candidatus Poribacteria bacterium]